MLHHAATWTIVNLQMNTVVMNFMLARGCVQDFDDQKIVVGLWITHCTWIVKIIYCIMFSIQP